MKEKTIYIARKIENREFCPILIYRDGIYIREYMTNRILYNTKTKEKRFKLIFGENTIMQMFTNNDGKYITANEETIKSYLECFDTEKTAGTKNNKIKKMIYDLLVATPPLENEIFRVKLNFVEEFDQVDNDENDLETILKSRTKTQDSISILVYFENGVAKELITGRTITYIKQKTEKIDAGRKIIEQNVVPGESGSVFFEISDDYPLYIPNDEDIEKYKAPAPLGNMNLNLTYIFSVGNEMFKSAIEELKKTQKRIGLKKEN